MVLKVKAGSSLRPSRKIRGQARERHRDHQEDDEGAMLQRPFGKIEPLTKSLRAAGPSGPDAAPARRRSRRSRRPRAPCEMTTVAGSKRCTSTLRSDTVMFAGSTIQTAGWPIVAGQRAGRNRDAGVGFRAACAPSPSRPGASRPADRSGRACTRNVRVTGSACGSTGPHAPLGGHGRIVGQRNDDLGIGGAERITWAGTSNTASRPSCRAT